MPKLLALDLSSSTGYAVFSYDQIPQQNPVLVKYGALVNPTTIKSNGVYPWGMMNSVEDMWLQISSLVNEVAPDFIVVEEIVIGRQRIVQKFLNALHYRVLQGVRQKYENKVAFVSPSDWRKMLGAVLTKEDKKQNAKLSKAKSQARRTGTKLDKIGLGIKKRLNKKDAALRFVNAEYGLSLRSKDDDVADGISIGLGYLRGAKICDGK